MVTNYTIVAEFRYGTSKVADRSVVVNTSLSTNLGLVGINSEILVDISGRNNLCVKRYKQ